MSAVYGIEWSGSTLASEVWIEYTGAVYTVYHLTIVSGLVENIGAHSENTLNHSFLSSGSEKQNVIFGSESNRNGSVYSAQVYCGCESDGMFLCNWVDGFYWVMRVKSKA